MSCLNCSFKFNLLLTRSTGLVPGSIWIAKGNLIDASSLIGSIVFDPSNNDGFTVIEEIVDNPSFDAGIYFIAIKVSNSLRLISPHMSGNYSSVTTPFDSVFQPFGPDTSQVSGYVMYENNFEEEYQVPNSGIYYNQDISPFVFFEVSINQ